MHRKLRLEGLRAELATVKSLLLEATDASDPIGRLQYEYRKKTLEHEISTLAEAAEKTASIALFFGGEPVFGSRGIAAEFAGHMLEMFQDLVSKSFAKTEVGLLGTRGPIPLKGNTRLMVTGVTKGSFGFVLDELSDQAELQDTSLKLMVDEVASLLEDTASPREPDFEKIIETVDERTLNALKEFFVTLDNNQATLRVVEDNRDFTLDAIGVQRGRIRTEATSIKEDDELISGILEGFLPDHKKFELRRTDGVVIYGSVSKEAVDQYRASETVPVRKEVQVRIRVRTVKPLNGTPRPVYRLLQIIEKPDMPTT